MTEGEQADHYNVAEWHGKMLIDRDGEKIGKLQEVYVDVENDQPQFATVKEGFIGRHLTFVPLGGITVGPDDLQVAVTKAQVESAANIEQHGEELSQADESALYHHFELNYLTPRADAGSPAADPSPRPEPGHRAREAETSCPPGIWTICEHKLGTPVSVTTCTKPEPMGSGRRAWHGCTSSNVCEGLRHVFARLRLRSGALAARAVGERPDVTDQSNSLSLSGKALVGDRCRA